jgi:hypothetical protein
MTPVEPRIEHGQVQQPVLPSPTVRYQPPGELLDGPQIVIAGLDTVALAAEVSKVSVHIAGRDVAEPRPLTGFGDSTDLRSRQPAVMVQTACFDQGQEAAVMLVEQLSAFLTEHASSRGKQHEPRLLGDCKSADGLQEVVLVMGNRQKDGKPIPSHGR